MYVKTNLPALLKREFERSPFVAFDRLFEEALGSVPDFNDFCKITPYKGNAYPKVNIIDNPDSVILHAAVPGLTKDDISIDLEEDVLTIIGESQNDVSDAGKNYTYREISKKSFRRSFVLEDDLEKDKIKAEVVNGMLAITIPKKNPKKQEESKKKKIKIN